MARRIRGRRKPRVVWLPTFGLGAGLEESSAAAGVSGQLSIDTNGVVYDAFPLTFDQGNYEAEFVQGQALVENFVPNLKDLVSGNEWKLRRIVGKCFIAATSDELDDPPELSAIVDCALGFIVCKTDEDGAPTTDFNEVNPLSQESMNDPWIWRRRWLLNPYGNSRTLDVIGDGRTSFNQLYPPTTAGYGSAVDGPHIDQKTARVIHKNERLFAIIAARLYFATGSEGAATTVSYLLDYRLLGSLRNAAMGNRNNASR